MSKILILGASELQLPAILMAKKMGIDTVVADYDANAIGREDADKFYEVSTLDFDGIEKIVQKEKIDGILTICSDRPMTTIAKIGEKYKLNTISYDASIKATNKAHMRDALAKANTPIPQYYICKNKKEYDEAVASMKLPFIVKPSDNSGSRGIFLVHDKEQVERAYEHSFKQAANGVILVEEYLQGPEVSVEVFVIEGIPKVIQITDKVTTGAPHFVELGHSQPSQLTEKDAIEKVAIEAVYALGITRGPAHVEIKITEDGPKIIELGARLGGDHITTDLVPLSTGVDMVKMTIEDALGLELTMNKNLKNYSKILYFLNNCDKYASLFENSGIDSLVSYAITNESLDSKSVASSNDRAGYFILANEDESQLNKDLEFIYKNV